MTNAALEVIASSSGKNCRHSMPVVGDLASNPERVIRLFAGLTGFLPLDEAIAYRAAFVIVSGQTARAEGNALK